MHEEFGLKSMHLVGHEDIRHKNYLSMVSGINRKITIIPSIYYETLYFTIRKQLLIISIFVMQYILEPPQRDVTYTETVVPKKISFAEQI